MDKFSFPEYIENQHDIIEKTEKRINFVMNLAFNWDRMYSPSDVKMRISECNKRTGCLDGAKDLDPVYRKIKFVQQAAIDSGFWARFTDYPTLVYNHVANLEMKMRDRKMTELEYDYINDTPRRTLLREWKSTNSFKK
ncbi:hypothetical protein K8R30_00325 [archaeon]|nr:hypothetical protein [archaeon]